MPENYKFFGTDKYMWDGELYDTKDAAEEAEKKLQTENFETKIIEEEGKFLLW